MKLNENLCIFGKKTVLIPYEKLHVPKYHAWMKDEELQRLTASEPLNLEEEYKMQELWRNDEDKLTFLVLDRAEYERCCQTDEIGALVGDTNLFLNVMSHNDEDQEKVGEIEIMIAEPAARRKGFGQEAVCLMLLFAIKQLDVTMCIAKIGLDNRKSIEMFKKLQFTEVCRSEVFQEITLEKQISKEWSSFLFSTIERNELDIKPYK